MDDFEQTVTCPPNQSALMFLPNFNSFMSQTGRQSLNISKVLCVIMGGGQGTRLFPGQIVDVYIAAS